MVDQKSLYRSLYLIRRFEETVLENFSKGVFYGTTHTYLGQEANAVGVLYHLQSEDIVVSNHRCHGHYLAYGGELRSLFAELMGKVTGVCAGRGGSQHLHWRNFYSNGILGGTLPMATGMALAEKHKASHAVVITFLGDGTLGEGIVYETLNMAALWRAPILYVLENNHIAQTTPVHLSVAGDIAYRFRAFGIPVYEIDTSDVLSVLSISGGLLDDIRIENVPQALILHTCRFGPHSKGDDTRSDLVIQQMRLERDPIQIQAARLEDKDRAKIEREVDREIQQAFLQAIDDPLASWDPSISSQVL